MVEPTQYVTHEASTADTHNDIKHRAWLILLVFAVFHQQVLHVGLAFHPSLNNLVQRSFGLYLVHEHGALVSSLVLPYGAYLLNSRYGNSVNPASAGFVFASSKINKAHSQGLKFFLKPNQSISISKQLFCIVLYCLWRLLW